MSLVLDCSWEFQGTTDGPRLTMETFYEIIKAVERQCSFLHLQEQSLTVTSRNRCFHSLHMFLFGGTKDCVIHEMVC